MKAERGSIGAAYVVANKPANPSSDCEMFREIMMRLTEEFPEKFSKHKENCGLYWLTPSMQYYCCASEGVSQKTHCHWCREAHSSCRCVWISDLFISSGLVPGRMYYSMSMLHCGSRILPCTSLHSCPTVLISRMAFCQSADWTRRERHAATPSTPVDKQCRSFAKQFSRLRENVTPWQRPECV
jgi:hypothetical protein